METLGGNEFNLVSHGYESLVNNFFLKNYGFN